MAARKPLHVERVPIGSVHQYPNNVMQHPEKNLRAIEKSLKRFGQYVPLVVQKSTDFILRGNGMHLVMSRLEWLECDIVRIDVDDLDAAALAIADNRLSDLHEWDKPELAGLLDTLEPHIDIEVTGFSKQELDAMVNRAKAELPELERCETCGQLKKAG